MELQFACEITQRIYYQCKKVSFILQWCSLSLLSQPVVIKAGLCEYFIIWQQSLPISISQLDYVKPQELMLYSIGLGYCSHLRIKSKHRLKCKQQRQLHQQQQHLNQLRILNMNLESPCLTSMLRKMTQTLLWIPLLTILNHQIAWHSHLLVDSTDRTH